MKLYIRNLATAIFLLLFSLCATAQTRTIGDNTDQGNNVIGAIMVEGSTVFNRQQLLTAYFDLLGSRANSENLEKLRNRLVAYYGEKNFYLPEITILQHPTLANVYHITIIEPKLTSFSVKGGSIKSQAEANGYLNSLVGSAISSSSMFRQLENTLRIRLQVGAKVVPLHIRETQRDFHIDVSLSGTVYSKVAVSNEGSDRLGKDIISAETRLSEIVPGFREVYFNTFNTLSSDGFRSLGTGFIVEANSNHNFFLDLSASIARLDNEDGLPEIEFHKQNFSLGWQYLISDDRNGSSGVSTALFARDFQQQQIVEDINEKIRIIDLGYWRYSIGQRYSLHWWANFAQGLDGMGAELTGPLADSTTDIDFSKFTSGITLQLLLPKDLSLRIDTQGQYSSANLPFSQRFAIASNTTARAYESGELNGDNGVGIKLELRKGFEASFLSSNYVPYFYYGIGQVKDNLNDESTTGASVGVGVRFLSQSLSAYLEVGKPLIEESVYRTTTPRTQASISYQF